MPFTVAIVGRPNVGKSTLFNRLVGRRQALVHPAPGVTRDRREGEGSLLGLSFRVIDTAGLEDERGDTLAGRMQAQTARAIDEAHVLMMLIDARAGITPLDSHFADMLRRVSKPVVLAANKCEGGAGAAGLIEAYGLGLGEPVPISAEHGQGLSALYDVIAPHAESAGPGEGDDADAEGGPLNLAIVGRPNVGKSTLVNRLLDDERVLTGPEPGVTRDSIWVDWSWRGRDIRLIDTAGLRRKARVSERLERLTAADTANAIRFAHVAVLLVDGIEGLEKSDLAIARQIAEEGRAMVLAVNKWDAVEDRSGRMSRIGDRLERSLPQVRGVPVLTLSALTGRGVNGLLPKAFEIYEVWNRRVDTGPLNRWFADAIDRHPPPIVDGRRLRLRYITQVKARPPTFALFTTRPSAVPESYLRYLANGLRDDFGLMGVPIRIALRKGRNPYAPGRA
ncbi:MAG: ribosome biogenesis GTPase Der [Defluviicoccus sp.]|nr:ribosome biogenesis GTPase Der [Defluviicoccus sp.]